MKLYPLKLDRRTVERMGEHARNGIIDMSVERHLELPPDTILVTADVMAELRRQARQQRVSIKTFIRRMVW